MTVTAMNPITGASTMKKKLTKLITVLLVVLPVLAAGTACSQQSASGTGTAAVTTAAAGTTKAAEKTTAAAAASAATTAAQESTAGKAAAATTAAVTADAASGKTAGKTAGKVQLGIDNLEKDFSILKGKKVGLITNATGVDSAFNSTIDILHANTNLTALFAPEHGIRGAAGAGDAVGGEKDAKSGLPVYSLYGDTRKPTDEMLSNVDILVYDIQDVGTRYYTYISTMQYAMQAAAAKHIPFVVLDRPNPLNGNDVQGEVLEDGFESFVGTTHVPQRYGLTSGELAQFMNTEDKIGCDLTVVKMTGWERSMYFFNS
jgi:uncharacterized protein YbbC (DUF1343 family)